jgi:hypothetical protein
MTRSRTTASGSAAAASRSPSSPLAASSVRYDAPTSAASATRSATGSSSTTSTVRDAPGFTPARSSAARRSSRPSGFVRKSLMGWPALASFSATRVATIVGAIALAPPARIARTTSQPLRSGRMRSSVIASKRRALARSIASRPVPTASTSWPASISVRASQARSCGSSSTTSTAFPDGPLAPRAGSAGAAAAGAATRGRSAKKVLPTRGRCARPPRPLGLDDAAW